MGSFKSIGQQIHKKIGGKDKELECKLVDKKQFSPPGACLYCIRCCVCIVCIVVFVVVHTLLSGTKKLDAKKKGKGKGKNKDTWV